jgi:hypothetical protein
LVRAVAANELGKILDDIEPEFVMEWASVEEVLEEVKRAEVAVPGVAGAFIWGLPFRVSNDARLQQWVFDVLIERKGPEPEVPYFNSLEWIAAEEVLSQSPDWIQALADVGKNELADWGALATKVRSPVVSAHLVAMTNDRDDMTARDAAAELALGFATTTPEAVNRGFVSVFEGHSLLKTFVVYDHDELVHPRILVLYPKHPRRSLTLGQADSAVEQLVPPEIRGEEKSDGKRRDCRLRREFSNRVYVTYVFAGETSQRVRRIEIIGNGIKGPAWNPVSLLQE